DGHGWGEVGYYGAGKRGGRRTEHIGGRGRRGIALYDVERAGLEREIAEDTHRGGRSPLTGNDPLTGNEEAASVDLGRRHEAVANQCSAEKAPPTPRDKLWTPPKLALSVPPLASPEAPPTR